jgi:hypothetical protein
MDIRDCLEHNAIPSMRLIHDCVDTGTELALVQDAEILYPVDCAGRDYKTAENLWDSTTSIFKNHIDNGIINFKIRMTLNGAKDSNCLVKIVVPHSTLGDIEVADKYFILHKNNLDTTFEWSSFVYMGTDAEAKTYGFKVSLIPNAGMTLKARSILVIA